MNSLWLKLETLSAMQLSVAILTTLVFVLISLSLTIYLRCQRSVALVQGEYESKISHLESENNKLAWALEHSEERLSTLQGTYEGLRNDERKALIELTELKSRYDEQKISMAKEVERLSSLKNNVVHEFESLLAQMMQNQQKHFVVESQQKVEAVLNPLQKQLDGFRRRVDEVHSEDVAQTHRLLGQIQQLQLQSKQIGDEAVNLTRALKGNNKAVGNWGEWILERLLEDSGLQKGRDFEVQTALNDEDGRKLQPDVILNLPSQRHIVIDSKVSLHAYERLLQAADDQHKQNGEKELLQSLKQHIKGLSKRSYEQLSQINCPDFVVMFIPVEPAYILALQLNPGLLRDARSHNIILAGPSTLLSILHIVESLWQRQRQDQNVAQIMLEAGKLYDQFVRFTESMSDVGSALQRAQGAYEQALSRMRDGKGNLIRRAEQLQELGAKNQKRLQIEEDNMTEV